MISIKASQKRFNVVTTFVEGFTEVLQNCNDYRQKLHDCRTFAESLPQQGGVWHRAVLSSSALGQGFGVVPYPFASAGRGLGIEPFSPLLQWGGFGGVLGSSQVMPACAGRPMHFNRIALFLFEPLK